MVSKVTASLQSNFSDFGLAEAGADISSRCAGMKYPG